MGSPRGAAARDGRPAITGSPVPGRRRGMDYYPLFLKIEDRTCVVVGGGAVAARKVAMLRRAGASVI